ncbi:MAG: helix-turn-helix transcriptional regulator [Acidobacteriota bacterium]
MVGPPSTPVSAPAFFGLGKALRWLRDKRKKKQYEVADAAGITKAMLSAYETGKQRPTIDTLEKILAAMEVDLGDLFDTLQVVNERPREMRYRDEVLPNPPATSALEDPTIDVRYILGDDQVEPEEEEAVAEMVQGYFRWLRVIRRRTRG